MANARWARDRARRDFIAEHDPCVPGRVLRRIIDIDETIGTMTEIVMRDFDSTREIRRKLVSIGLTLAKCRSLEFVKTQPPFPRRA